MLNSVCLILAADVSMDELEVLIGTFREHGGVFENLAIGYRPDSGYYCSAIDSHQNATMFCPAHLLVDIEDVDINETGLYISRPDNYAGNIEFLQRYFSFHFDEKLVIRLLE